MAVSAGVAIGTGVAAAAGATAAAIRAVRQNTKASQQTYGGNPSVIGTSAAPSSAQGNPYAVGRQGVGAGSAMRDASGRLTQAGVDAAASKYGFDDLSPGQKRAVIDDNGNLTRAGQYYRQHVNRQAAEVNPYQVDFNRNRADAQGVVDTGLAGIASGSQAAEQQRLIGLGLMNGNGPGFTTAGSDALAAYQPGAVSQAMAQQVLNRNAQANLGAARSGGALGLRNALNANAQAGVSAQADMAAQAAQEQERYLAAQLQQANADRAAQQAQISQGIGMSQGALAQGLDASNAYTRIGAGLEGSYLDAEQHLLDQQLIADLDYDRRRQAEGQRKSDRLWDMAGGLIGIGGKALGSMGG